MSFLIPRDEPPLEAKRDLLAYFEAGARPSAELVGLEVESLPVRAATAEAATVDDVLQTLERIGQGGGFTAQTEAGRTVHLAAPERSVGLEPGGQVELSGAPHHRLADAAAELHAHLDTLKRSSPPGLAWLALGEQPVARVGDIPWMPKSRYRILADFLAPRGELGHHMMKKTATIQASFDYTSAADAMDLLRTALQVTPALVAMTANSPYADGAFSGHLSHRMAIWEKTDPERSGRFAKALDPAFDLEAYVDHVLDLPMVFFRRKDAWMSPGGLTFRRFLERGREGQRATVFDWELHLSSFFPDARLKRVVEVRGADCPPRHLMMPIVAFMTGILYGPRTEVRAVLGGVGPDQILRAQREAARVGLRAELAGRSMSAVATDLLAVARRGLQARPVLAGPDPAAWLAPLDELVASGRSPAETLVARFGDRPADVAGLVAATAL